MPSMTYKTAVNAPSKNVTGSGTPKKLNNSGIHVIVDVKNVTINVNPFTNVSPNPNNIIPTSPFAFAIAPVEALNFCIASLTLSTLGSADCITSACSGNIYGTNCANTEIDKHNIATYNTTFHTFILSPPTLNYLVYNTSYSDST